MCHFRYTFCLFHFYIFISLLHFYPLLKRNTIMRLGFLLFLMPVALFFSSFLPVSAENALVVELKDGTTQYFFLADKPTITFEGTKLHINSTDFSEELTNISRFRFDPEADREAVSISSLQSDKKVRAITYLDGKNLMLQGVDSVSDIKIFTTDGRMVSAKVNSDSSGASINLEDLPAGVYVIRTNSQSFKISKK